MSVQAGQDAPDFTLKNTERQDVTLSSLRGQKNVVVLFVPFAFSWRVYHRTLFGTGQPQQLCQSQC